MTRSDFQKTMRSIEQLNKDLDKLLRDLQSLSRHLGKELGSVVESGVTDRLRAAQAVLDSFSRLAAAMQNRVGEVTSEVTSRIPGSRKAAPKAKKRTTRKAKRAAKRPAKRAARGAAKPAPKAASKRPAKGRAKTKITSAGAKKALAATGGVKTKAAKKLGVSVPTLNKYLKAAA